ncbi:hypothetical protein AB0M54_37615 [Actinoplanes sp. NPDC051470]|uniref:hypothetical protein n=1 Tax=Actinoplanes sp. NPDC051470 TaxID=3157224 RepID=UPI0034155A5E
MEHSEALIPPAAGTVKIDLWSVDEISRAGVVGLLAGESRIELVDDDAVPGRLCLGGRRRKDASAATRSSGVFWGSDGGADSPKFLMYSGADAFMSPEAQARYGRPESAFTLLLGMRLRSRGSCDATVRHRIRRCSL